MRLFYRIQEGEAIPNRGLVGMHYHHIRRTGWVLSLYVHFFHRLLRLRLSHIGGAIEITSRILNRETRTLTVQQSIGYNKIFVSDAD